MRKIRTGAWSALLPALALIAVPATGEPISMPDFVKNRIERFAALKAEHPQQPTEIEQIKQRTAAIVAALPPVSQSARAAATVLWRTQTAPVVIFDIPVAPRMVVVPAGEFTMGPQPGTGPAAVRRRVRIDHAFAVGMFPVVVGEFALFVEDSGYQAAGSCITLEQSGLSLRKGRDWRNPQVSASPRDPVTCVSQADASAYASWLSRKTGQHYRLLSEAEYEYVNRAGTDSTYWWGDSADVACTYTNGLDQDATELTAATQRSACHDGQAAVAQVGSYKSNAFGLFDTAGNVESWVADCWRGAAAHACTVRPVRGSSWITADLASARRSRAAGSEATSYRGFRLARDL